MNPLSPSEAEDRIFSLRGKVPSVNCALEAAAGKILRQDITADHDLPPFDRVMMDGLAVRLSGCRRFLVQGVAAAGQPQIALPPAEDAAIEVMTGAVPPDGVDAVLPCEWYDLHDGGAVLQPGKKMRAGDFIHRKGSDHRAGDALLRSGVRLGPVEIGIAAACGYAGIQVAAPLRMAVFGTGGELGGELVALLSGVREQDRSALHFLFEQPLQQREPLTINDELLQGRECRDDSMAPRAPNHFCSRK